jgi:hypothetical protein
MVNIHPATVDQFYKISSINLSPNSIGQIALSCMVNPPAAGESSCLALLVSEAPPPLQMDLLQCFCLGFQPKSRICHCNATLIDQLRKTLLELVFCCPPSLVLYSVALPRW